MRDIHGMGFTAQFFYYFFRSFVLVVAKLNKTLCAFPLKVRSFVYGGVADLIWYQNVFIVSSSSHHHHHHHRSGKGKKETYTPLVFFRNICTHTEREKRMRLVSGYFQVGQLLRVLYILFAQQAVRLRDCCCRYVRMYVEICGVGGQVAITYSIS